jgi:hypothetical protein
MTEATFPFGELAQAVSENGIGASVVPFNCSGVMKLGCWNGAANWAECSDAPFGSVAMAKSKPAELQPTLTIHKQSRPVCVSMEVAAIFGWPNYYLPFLVRAGHLKPLGKPAQNARKWFATVDIERMSCDPDWLDKAIRIVEKQIQEMNRKQRGREADCAD